MNMATAVEKVLNVTELLENILLNVTMRQLLVSRQVCELWMRTILRSRALRKELFFTSWTQETVTRASTVPVSRKSDLQGDTCDTAC